MENVILNDMVSSVNALNYFADIYVSEGMRDSFKELIKEYESGRQLRKIVGGCFLRFKKGLNFRKRHIIMHVWNILYGAKYSAPLFL